MRSSKRTDKRKLLSHIRALSSDPDFVAGAKEVLARKPKPFDYDGRRNDKSQINYEVGRLIAIRVLQSSLCFLIMIALWAIPALAQQTWWMLARSSPQSQPISAHSSKCTERKERASTPVSVSASIWRN